MLMTFFDEDFHRQPLAASGSRLTIDTLMSIAILS